MGLVLGLGLGLGFGFGHIQPRVLRPCLETAVVQGQRLRVGGVEQHEGAPAEAPLTWGDTGEVWARCGRDVGEMWGRWGRYGGDMGEV